jgi:hypothetical protein
MSEIEIAKWVVLTVMGFAIWFLKRNIEQQDKMNTELKEEINKVREQSKKDVLDIRDNYLHRNDFRDFKEELKSYLKEIRDDLKSLMRVNNDSK